MKAKSVDNKGQPTGEIDFDLANWATETLNNLYNHHQVIFIQGEPGHGKSVFCRMYADWVRRNLYPKVCSVMNYEYCDTIRKNVVS